MKQIVLSSGKTCLVSDEDYDYLCQWAWSTNSTGRLTRCSDSEGCVLMHVEVVRRMGLKIECGFEVDHEDRNYLNNQRSNLRLATKSQNQANSNLRIDSTSGYKGVTWHVRIMRWQAKIQVRKTRIFLGYFKTPEEAARAYDKAAKRYFGEFANLNFKE